MATGRRFRGLGKGRKTRRVLERGGAGPAARLNRALGEWPGVRPHRRFASRGWIELDVRTETDVAQALRWLRRARAVSDAEAGDAE